MEDILLGPFLQGMAFLIISPNIVTEIRIYKIFDLYLIFMRFPKYFCRLNQYHKKIIETNRALFYL